MTFDFHAPTRIVFGPGRRSELPQLARELGSRVLIVTGSTPSRHQALIEALEASGQAVLTLSLDHEPTVADAQHGCEAARAHRAEWILGIGGGSVVDAAKAIAGLTPNPGDPLDYLEVIGHGRPLTQRALPLIALPTTAGTGAEVTRNAVLASPSHGVKVSLRSPYLYPHTALIDPELALDLPPGPTAAAGLDAIVQLIEPFVSSRAQPLSDALCREGLVHAARALPRLLAHPRDLKSRSDLAFAALCSGYALAQAGLGAVHGFAGVLGGTLGAPHGALCARLLAPVLRGHLRWAPPDRAAGLEERLTEIARLLTINTTAEATDAADWAEAQCTRCAIPRLGALGLTAGAIPQVAAQAARASSMKANPFPLTEAQLQTLLTEAL